MAAPTAAQLIALWDRSSASPPHRRLEPLLAAIDPGAVLDEDTLGTRNRRLLALHAALSAAPLEARVHCTACRTENAFAVPAAAILDCKTPGPAVRVSVRSGARRLVFRLPVMADIKAAAAAPADDPLSRIVARCRVGEDQSEPISARDLALLASRFEALDPAARIVIELRCAECGAALRASVDIAEFVAAGVDRIVDALLRDIHAIARAYGWSESEIVALPPVRRRLYVSMIAATAAAAQPARTPLALRA